MTFSMHATCIDQTYILRMKMEHNRKNCKKKKKSALNMIVTIGILSKKYNLIGNYFSTLLYIP